MLDSEKADIGSFSCKSKHIGEVINDCEILGYKSETRQYLLQCTKCGAMLMRNRATVSLGKAKCQCSYTRLVRHTDGYCNTKLKSVYLNMLDRCYNKNNHAFNDYGARGIRVWHLWETDFRQFMEWAVTNGYKNGLTLDRIDNNGDYCPQNCRWVDRKAQANNRRSNVIVTYNGCNYTVAQLAEILGINYQTLYSKIRRGRI